jgi:glycosyltransferase involved in cell wall biosynthesis
LRVLHVAHGGPQYGGVEVMLRTIAAYRSVTPEIEHVFALRVNGRLGAELTAAGCAVHYLPDCRIRRPAAIHRTRREFRRLLEREKFDAVVVQHSTWLWVIFAPAARRLGIPLVLWVHEHSAGRHWMEVWARMTRPGLVIFNSKFTCSSSRNLHPGAPCRVVRCPVDFPELTLCRESRDSIRRKFGTPERATVIVQVGRMAAYKGQLIHLEALGRLRELPNWECWQVGGAQLPEEERYMDALRSRASALGIAERVKFVGYRANPHPILSAADIYCQPNLTNEPFGLTFVEALWNGLPVVTSAMGGALEIVDESCGRLVPPGDPEALAGALARLIKDPELRARLGAAGPAHARELCDPEGQMAQIANVLSSI